MSKWHVAIQRRECRECGGESYPTRETTSCPHCGWTNKQQTEFDKKNNPHPKPRKV